MPPRRPLLTALVALLAAGGETPLLAGPPTGPDRPFRITVIDEATRRGVPLVELRTVNQILYVTDSNGVVAFDEPGMMGRRVHFTVKSHGYEARKDGFGIAGFATEPQPGGEATVEIRRINVAERLYRVTGGGIYRDSILTGVPAPLREPVLDGLVLGQDSVLNAVYRGKVHWFWGDTNWPGYPLGNFHTPGATSELPSRGGLDPSKGVDLTYYLDEKGFARPTCKMPGDGPTWITGLVVLKDAQGRERMFANYAKIKPPLSTYERGAVEWDPEAGEFVKRAVFSGAPETGVGETLGGHTFLHRDGDREYVYYCNPFPLTRVPATPEGLIDEDSVEVFSCLEPGTRVDDRRVDRDPQGRIRYGWKKKTQRVDQEGQRKLVGAGAMKPEEGLIQLRDVETGKPVVAHGGSISWNAHLDRWLMLFVQAGGTSFLGEVWVAQAGSPLGPWTYARKVATHDDYSFYNPKQHPMFEQEGGRLVYFEGTYTNSFTSNKLATPRYEYNQVMYRLDLSDPRLALPVAVPDPMGPASRGVAFFAPTRPGLAARAVVEARDERGGATLGLLDAGAAAGEGAPAKFYVLPADSRLAETTPLYEYFKDGSSQRAFGIDPEHAEGGWRRSPKPVGRVWRNPGPPHVW